MKNLSPAQKEFEEAIETAMLLAQSQLSTRSTDIDETILKLNIHGKFKDADRLEELLEKQHIRDKIDWLARTRGYEN